MKRLAVPLVVLVAAGLLAGCTAAEARRAEALLRQAQLAQRQVRTESFVLRLGVEGAGRTVSINIGGGARAGDFFMQMSGSGFPGSNALDVAAERLGGTVTIRAGGQSETLPALAARTKLGLGNVAGLVGAAQYVKSVSVDATDLDGRPADRIVGTVDMQRLIASLGGVGSSALGIGGVHVGDARVVLFVPRDTHLVEVMLVDTTISAHGQSVDMHLSLALDGVNKPLSFPVF